MIGTALGRVSEISAQRAKTAATPAARSPIAAADMCRACFGAFATLLRLATYGKRQRQSQPLSDGLIMV